MLHFFFLGQEKLLNSLYDNLDDEENDPPLPSESSRTQAGTARSHRWLQPSQSYTEFQQHANYYSQPYFHGLSPNSAGPHTTFTPMAQLQGVDLSDVMKSQQAILKSQENIMKIVETVSARVGTLEKVLEKLPDSLSTSPDEKKRLPPELSVGYINTSMLYVINYRNLLLQYITHLMRMTSFRLTKGQL